MTKLTIVTDKAAEARNAKVKAAGLTRSRKGFKEYRFEAPAAWGYGRSVTVKARSAGAAYRRMIDLFPGVQLHTYEHGLRFPPKMGF